MATASDMEALGFAAPVSTFDVHIIAASDAADHVAAARDVARLAVAELCRSGAFAVLEEFDTLDLRFDPAVDFAPTGSAAAAPKQCSLDYCPQGSPFVLPMIELVLRSNPDRVAADAASAATWLRQHVPADGVTAFVHPNSPLPQNDKEAAAAAHWLDHFAHFDGKVVVRPATPPTRPLVVDVWGPRLPAARLDALRAAAGCQ